MKKINTAFEAKKTYISPMTSAQSITHSGVLCASGGVRSNIGIYGGGSSGNVEFAY